LKEKTKIGIIICDRYRNCGGGKCFRALKSREGGFDIYPKEENVEVAGYGSCEGCPGGNIEYLPEEMKKNDVEIIHFATGFVVGYPPCPYINYFREFIRVKFGMKVVVGTHPIPQKYFETHTKLRTWDTKEFMDLIKPTLTSKRIRLQYD